MKKTGFGWDFKAIFPGRYPNKERMFFVMSMPIGLQLYTVRDAMEQDFEGTLKKVKEFGYDGVEFAGLFGHTAAEVKNMCAEIGLTPISAHVPLDEMIAAPEEVLGVYKDIGCKYVVVPYLPEEKRAGTPAFAQTMADIEMLCKVAKSLGLVMLYHNHDFEFQKIDGKYVLDYMYDTIPASLLQTELDTCWVNVGGENPAQYVLKYTGRAPIVHLKDFVMQGREKPQHLYELIGIETDGQTAQDEAFGFRPVGSGVQDFPAILAASEKAGAQWVIVEQDRPAPGEEPVASAKKSIDYLRSFAW